MRRLLLALTLTVLCVGQVFAGVKYETTAGVPIDSLRIGFTGLATTGAIITDVDMGWIADTVVWQTARTKKPNKSTHYVSGLDTIITLHRIECDTTTVEKLIINDTTVIRLNVECDTVYRVEYRDVWEPKVKVYLNPDQLKQLMWLIQNSDMIEMKKEYGKQ